MIDTTLSPYLRRVLLADALVSGSTGLLLWLGAPLLAEVLLLPETLLRPAGIFLLPYSALVALLATRAYAPRWGVWAVIIANMLWAIGSILLLITDSVAPNALGTLFVIAQALIVAGFAVAQLIGLRQPMQRASQSS